MLAAQVGHVKIVETLLGANADPSITDKVHRVNQYPLWLSHYYRSVVRVHKLAGMKPYQCGTICISSWLAHATCTMYYRTLSSVTFQWHHVMATASLAYSAKLRVKLRSHSAMRKSSVRVTVNTWSNRLLSCQVNFLTAVHFAWIQLSVFLLDLHCS